MSGGYHTPVLLDETLALLLGDPDGVYVDGTLGGGGHAAALAARLGPHGLLLGVDRDPEALQACRHLEAEFPGRVRLLQGSFGDLPRLLAGAGVATVEGVLLDLGVSSHQLDRGERGFSFLRDGPLDMRMGPASGVTAQQLVNEWPEADLVRLLREYGEEPRAGRVARAIVRERERDPICGTAHLARVIEKALGWHGGKHPATRAFQALRIAVNAELDALDAALAALPELVAGGGRVAVIAYHSLEDRRVKTAFRDWQPRCRCPRRAPRCVCGTPGLFRTLTRKAVRPQPSEVAANPRARSARLRAAERLPAALPATAWQGDPT